MTPEQVIRVLRESGVRRSMSPEWRESDPDRRRKISEALRGRKRPDVSAYLTGKELPPEHRKAISDGLTDTPLTPEHRKAISEGSKGKKGWCPTPDQRRRISESLKGRPLSPETKKKISEALTGRRLSPEHRETMSVSVGQLWERRRAEKKKLDDLCRDQSGKLKWEGAGG